MFPCALPSKEEPEERLLLQNLMVIRITPNACPIHPNHAPPHSFPPISHPGWFGGACRGPLESLVEECTCLVCPAFNRCCLPTASAQSGPTAGNPTNPTIQLQSCESSANHTLESYPRIIPPAQTPCPTTVNKYTPIFVLFQFLPFVCFFAFLLLLYAPLRHFFASAVVGLDPLLSCFLAGFMLFLFALLNVVLPCA